MTIGQNIRALRKKKGLTQAQLGALCGISGGAVGSYENGITVPKRRVVEKIAHALDVPAERIMDSAPPSFAAGSEAVSGSDALLYDGILAVLKELYGMVEGRVILGENGARKRYYLIRQIPGDFVLYEEDIAAIVRSAKASTPPLAAYLHRVRAGGINA
jgi:transcriptional regulator with XRE-family HTH domain